MRDAVARSARQQSPIDGPELASAAAGRPAADVRQAVRRAIALSESRWRRRGASHAGSQLGRHRGRRHAVCGVFAGRLAGFASGIKLGTATELLVAGRAMPFWMATITMAATWIDGGYLLGTAEGAMTSIASGWQGGVCFGLSLVLGGIFFARRMRRLEVRDARRSARRPVRPALVGRACRVPALLGEVFWSAELLVAVGATFGVMLGVESDYRRSSFRPPWSRSTRCWAACGASDIPTRCSFC